MTIEFSWLALYRAILVIVTLLGLAGVYLAFNLRNKAGGTPLIILFIGAVIYVATKLAVSVVRGMPEVFMITRFNPLGAGLATVGFFFLVLEYTGIEESISRRTGAFVLVFPVAVNTLVWLDIEYLWIPTGQDAGSLSGYAWELTSIALANQLYMNLLLIAGFILLIRFGLHSATPFKLQAGALVLAGLAPLVGNFIFYVGYVPFNLTPIMFVFSGVVILGLLVRGRLLDLVPISRATVYESLEAGVLTTDTEHRVVDINRFARRVFGFDGDDDVIGHDIDEVFADQPAVREIYWENTETESDKVFEMEHDGRYYDIDTTNVHSSNGSVIGCSLIIRDTTDRRERKEALERKNAELERLVSVMSHDIGNPLQVIQGHVQLAVKNDDIEPHLDRIKSSAERIETLMNDMLTLTRGADPTDIERVNIKTVAERAWTHVDTKSATLETACDVSIEADRDRLEQLFENAFRNAIDHGESVTTVRVGTVTNSSGQPNGFFIADDGVGIQIDEQEAILEDGYTTSQDGTGLGLSIISKISDAHGWALGVTASETGGARFDITDINIVDH